MGKEKKPRADDLLFDALKGAGFSPEREHFLNEHRGFRFDFAWPEIKLAVEVDGAGYGHQQISARIKDMEKINAATELGWKVLVYPTSRINTNCRRAAIVDQIKRVICGVECPESAAHVLTGEL
jgi:very-short-patch-repair endonuclease